jgi:mono/diheme cytochrome c family protein
MTMNRRLRVVTIVLALGWVGALHAAVRSASQEPCAPALLSETGLYEASRPGAIARGVRQFSPQYPLWTDGAKKARWISLPPGTAIDTTVPGEWSFPVGTRFWKEFAFAGRKVETRLIWRATADRWIFATYVWNEEQTDAVLAPPDGVSGVAEVAAGRRHDIPGESDCRACHGTERPGPLGFNALQLSTDRDPNAIHGEPLAPGMITVATLSSEGRLSPSRPELVANPPRIEARSPRTRAVLGYLAANCGTCHHPAGGTSFSGPSLKHSDLRDGDDVVARLLRYATTWQVPGQPEGTTLMLNAALPDASAMLARMRSRRPSSQMPPLGTVLRDEKAIAAIENWIATDLVKR